MVMRSSFVSSKSLLSQMTLLDCLRVLLILCQPTVHRSQGCHLCVVLWIVVVQFCDHQLYQIDYLLIGGEKKKRLTWRNASNHFQWNTALIQTYRLIDWSQLLILLIQYCSHANVSIYPSLTIHKQSSVQLVSEILSINLQQSSVGLSPAPLTRFLM